MRGMTARIAKIRSVRQKHRWGLPFTNEENFVPITKDINYVDDEEPVSIVDPKKLALLK